MAPLPLHLTPRGTPCLAIWANLNIPVLQTKLSRFGLTVLHIGPEVVLDISRFRPNWAYLPPRGPSLSPRNLVMIAATEPEIWGVGTK